MHSLRVSFQVSPGIIAWIWDIHRCHWTQLFSLHARIICSFICDWPRSALQHVGRWIKIRNTQSIWRFNISFHASSICTHCRRRHRLVENVTNTRHLRCYISAYVFHVVFFVSYEMTTVSERVPYQWRLRHNLRGQIKPSAPTLLPYCKSIPL